MGFKAGLGGKGLGAQPTKPDPFGFWNMFLLVEIQKRLFSESLRTLWVGTMVLLVNFFVKFFHMLGENGLGYQLVACRAEFGFLRGSWSHVLFHNVIFEVLDFG